MSKNVYPNRRMSNMFYPLAIIIVAYLVLTSTVSLAIEHPTSYPYETRPAKDGYLV